MSIYIAGNFIKVNEMLSPVLSIVGSTNRCMKRNQRRNSPRPSIAARLRLNKTLSPRKLNLNQHTGSARPQLRRVSNVHGEQNQVQMTVGSIVDKSNEFHQLMGVIFITILRS